MYDDDYKLRTIEAENLKKLRTFNFNSKCTGSYKKNILNYLLLTGKEI